MPLQDYRHYIKVLSLYYMFKSSFVRSEGAFPHFQRGSFISVATTSKPVSRLHIPEADSSEKNQTLITPQAHSCAPQHTTVLSITTQRILANMKNTGQREMIR